MKSYYEEDPIERNMIQTKVILINPISCSLYCVAKKTLYPAQAEAELGQAQRKLRFRLKLEDYS